MPLSTFTFADLLVWSERLLDWQRDALRRVLISSLTDADIADLAAMAKAAWSLPTPGRPSPDPATRNHVRSSGASTRPVALLAVRDITYVNALASGPVAFAPEGLTVIYGDNASGKSGIARILKKAGRARNPGRSIRPSVFDPDPGKPASANIEFRVGTEDRSFSWVDGSATGDELTRINVFDASCAAVQIEKSNYLIYRPEILQVFQDLAEACRAVAAKLQAEKDALDNARTPQIGLLTLRPHTAAGALVENLSPQTKPNDIDALCNVNDTERERFNTLTRALQDNRTGQADLLEARARRLKDLDNLTMSLEVSLSDSALQNFETQLSDADAAAEAAKAASQSFAASSALAGLGTQAWKQLWESARRYSETLAYPAEYFPVTREDALCLLCQQPIDRTAAQRLTRFEQFVQDDVQQRAEQARGGVQARKIQLEALNIPLSGTQQREAALRGTPTGQSVRAFIVAAKLRRRYLLRKANARRANRPGGFPPRPDLTALRESLVEEIKRLRAAAQDAERRKMQSEFAELDDRLKLAPLKDILKQEVARFIYCALLDRARNDCDTTWITRKGGEVAQLVVTARLRSAFASNLSHLGFTAAPVEVKLGLGTVGQHPYSLSLIAHEDVPPSEVLSEGEKTCVALAGFLAELETTNNGSGIVLDDPVSSLDHHYRLRVARKLVDAAKQRQVVVFTHDIVFLLMLTKYARKGGVALKECSLRRGGTRHGLPEEGPPWVAMTVSKRVGLLRNELQAAATVLRKGDRATYEQKTEWIYDRLRQSWERAVEEVLLNEVVVRFGDGVSTQRLKALTDITDADVQCVDTEMTYCSSFVHDESGAVNAGIPDPPVVEADIKRLDDWVAALRKRRK
jgi:energy-coupling factor transporter ATP-binding protein EcfA2